MAQDAYLALPDSSWPHLSASRFVEVEGCRWHYQQIGRGPTVLLIHGTGASGHSWEGIVDTLCSEFSLVVIDLPGHGYTQPLPTSEMSLDGLSARLGTLLRNIGIVPDCVVGHSAGAAIAIRSVLDGWILPPKVIVGVNGALLPFSGVSGWLFPSMARILSSGSMAARFLAMRAEQPGAVARMLEGTGSRPPTRSIAVYERLLRRPSQIKAALDMMAMWDLGRLQRDLKQLRVPLDLIACSEDNAVSPEIAFSVRDIVSSARVDYVRGFGHLAHEEAPETIAALIRKSWTDHATAVGDADFTPALSNGEIYLGHHSAGSR